MIRQFGAKARLGKFVTAQDGAITVDWIVLTAAIVFMGMGTAFFVAASVPDVADNVSNYMESVEVDGSAQAGSES